MKLRVIGEGPDDVGRGPARETGAPHLGAVRILVRREVERCLGRALREDEIDGAPLPRLHSGGYETKVRRGLLDASKDGRDSVVIVVDRDGPENRGRSALLEAGIERVRREDGDPIALRTVSGLAIETMEAWLLSDVAAINAALRPQPPEREHPNPESYAGRPGTSDHPKARFRAVASRATASGHRARDAVAEQADLDVIARRCPEGYGKLARALRALATPE